MVTGMAGVRSARCEAWAVAEAIAGVRASLGRYAGAVRVHCGHGNPQTNEDRPCLGHTPVSGGFERRAHGLQQLALPRKGGRMTMTNGGVNKALRRADELIGCGDAFSGALMLGELWAGRSRLPAKQVASVEQRLVEYVARLDAGRMHEALVERRDRLRRILFTGGTYLYEELVLVLTVRIECTLVMSLFAEAAGHRLDVSFEDCDLRLEEISKEARNRHAYRSAIKAIETNWPEAVPLRWGARPK